MPTAPALRHNLFRCTPMYTRSCHRRWTMRRTGTHTVCAAVVAAVGWMHAASAGAQTPVRLFCRWGKPAKMAPVPKCGIPRELEVKVPANTWKLYFLRGENPGLSGYFHRGRAIGAKPKVFHRKVNLVNVVLLLCPADFKGERVLAFQRYNNQRRLSGRPTCRLSPPGKAGTPRAGTRPVEPPKTRPDPGAGTGGTAGAAKTGAGTSAAGSKKAGAAGGGGVYDAAAGSKPSSGSSKASWKKIDRLARLLGLTALALALCCLVALGVVYRYFSRKLRKVEEDS